MCGSGRRENAPAFSFLPTQACNGSVRLTSVMGTEGTETEGTETEGTETEGTETEGTETEGTETRVQHGATE